jgi:DNA-binding XRE family transcriptional regulator
MRYRKQGQDVSLPPAQAARIETNLERSPEEQLELERIRDWFVQHKPGPEEFDPDEPEGLESPFGASSAPCFPSRQIEELGALMAQLKARRQAANLSLADISQRSGITRAAISRLENGHTLNPTLETIFRLARAVDTDISLIANAIDPATNAPPNLPTIPQSTAEPGPAGP